MVLSQLVEHHSSQRDNQNIQNIKNRRNSMFLRFFCIEVWYRVLVKVYMMAAWTNYDFFYIINSTYEIDCESDKLRN